MGEDAAGGAVLYADRHHGDWQHFGHSVSGHHPAVANRHQLLRDESCRGRLARGDLRDATGRDALCRG